MSIKHSARAILFGLQKQPHLLDLIRRVWRFTRPRYTAGAVAIIFNDAGEVLLVEHVFHAFIPWGLPGGYLDRREDPDKAVLRELREELELEAEISQIIRVERNFGDHLDFTYLCHPRGAVGKLSMELKAYRWIALVDLPVLPDHQREAIMEAAARVAVVR